MIMTLATAALLALQSATPPSPQTAPDRVALSAQNSAALRCSAAFALVSYGQDNGNEAAMKWPALDARGREFFVRTLARIMDDTGIDRDGAAKLIEREAQGLLDNGQIDSIMPPCLALLDAAGL